MPVRPDFYIGLFCSLFWVTIPFTFFWNVFILVSKGPTSPPPHPWNTLPPKKKRPHPVDSTRPCFTCCVTLCLLWVLGAPWPFVFRFEVKINYFYFPKKLSEEKAWKQTISITIWKREWTFLTSFNEWSWVIFLKSMNNFEKLSMKHSCQLSLNPDNYI